MHNSRKLKYDSDELNRMQLPKEKEIGRKKNELQEYFADINSYLKFNKKKNEMKISNNEKNKKNQEYFNPLIKIQQIKVENHRSKKYYLEQQNTNESGKNQEIEIYNEEENQINNINNINLGSFPCKNTKLIYEKLNTSQILEHKNSAKSVQFGYKINEMNEFMSPNLKYSNNKTKLLTIYESPAKSNAHNNNYEFKSKNTNFIKDRIKGRFDLVDKTRKVH